eukprot:1161157-Pelagomonas_calceolata.AAC.2
MAHHELWHCTKRQLSRIVGLAKGALKIMLEESRQGPEELRSQALAGPGPTFEMMSGSIDSVFVFFKRFLIPTSEYNSEQF